MTDFVSLNRQGDLEDNRCATAVSFESNFRTAFSVAGLMLAGFVLLVVTTEAYQYGMPMMAEHAALWRLGRVPSAVAWLALVLGVFLFKGVIYPDSFLRSFVAAFIAVAIGVILAGTEMVQLGPVAQSAVYYSLGAGLFGMTFRSWWGATLAGLVGIAGQVGIDIAVHLSTGAIQLA